jgi:alkanesulfonate monooxygenase SsuD/methylene tetrahydromethanopterin reductase-like flavin-dependent oxidoreductase (luciferase family)
VLDKTEAIVTLMDRVGYNTFWAAEHRFQREGYECIPNLLLLFVHLAHITTRLKFGCGFNVAPMWHPLRLAEDFAVADRLTGGRIIFGVGRGYHSRECEVLGAPSTAIDNEANRELFEDQVDILFKAFNSRAFSHYSKHYTIPPRIPYRGYELQDITLVPKPHCTGRVLATNRQCQRAGHGLHGQVWHQGHYWWWCGIRRGLRQSGPRLSRCPGAPRTRDGIGR